MNKFYLILSLAMATLGILISTRGAINLEKEVGEFVFFNYYTFLMGLGLVLIFTAIKLFKKARLGNNQGMRFYQ